MSQGEELGRLAADLARDAAAMVHAGRRAGWPDAATKSSATDVVTAFDTASEAMIVGRLRERRPHDAILGEEGTVHAGTSGIEWRVDPIDGTTNFLYGLPTYSVSIAAVDEEGELAGAVCAPGTGELFTAVRGSGARLNGEEIRCSQLTDISTALLATGFGYQRERRREQAARLARLIAHVRDMRRFGSAALDLCYTACGRIDAYYEQYLNPWDIAAGVLIAREAGARVGTFGGAAGEPDGLLVGGPGVFDDLAELLRRTSTAS
jgi:myo-inositol-1(or 4)-monophosphatase